MIKTYFETGTSSICWNISRKFAK